jgi:hypothetical protein
VNRHNIDYGTSLSAVGFRNADNLSRLFMASFSRLCGILAPGEIATICRKIKAMMHRLGRFACR